MTDREWLEPAMTALVRIERGEASPQDYQIAQEALLRLPPSGSIYRRIAEGLKSAPPPIPVADEFSSFADPSTAPITTAPRGYNAADQNDTQGSFPIGSDVEVPEWDPAGPIESFRPEPSMKDQPLMGGPGNAMEEFGYELPEGFTFSDAGPHAVDIWSQNPSAYLTNYAEEKGGGANMAAYLENPMKSALAMARMGMLGGGYGDDLFAGQGMGSASELARVESFLNDFSQPGQFVDPQAVMQDVVGRGARTNFEGMKNPQTNMPYTPEEIINITNAAISASATFMGPEGEDWLNSILLAKGDEYINAIARGEIDANTSYPKWLQEQGIGELI